jgi:hypothetical protein
VLDLGRSPRAPEHRHHVDADLSGTNRVRLEPGTREATEPGRLGVGDASAGRPYAALVLVFTSHTTSTSPSRATMSISPCSQRQLRASTTSRPGQMCRGDVLAVPPHAVLARMGTTSAEEPDGDTAVVRRLAAGCGRGSLWTSDEPVLSR